MSSCFIKGSDHFSMFISEDTELTRDLLELGSIMLPAYAVCIRPMNKEEQETFNRNAI